jgi:arylsulfatase A-like enzyme
MLGRRDFLKTTGLLAAVSSPAQTRKPGLAQTRKPNLLLMVASGWRAPALDPDLPTPHLARLAAEGARFKRLYVSCPAASPSQASLITGRFPFACGVPSDGQRLPLDQPSIAMQLQNAGYYTGFAGEWRLDDPGTVIPPGPSRHGFEFWSTQVADAESFVRQHFQKPFFLLLSWGRQARQHGAELYNRSRLPLRANVPETSAAEARAGYAAYYETCSAINDGIGRLLAVLEEQRLADNTLVVFTSGYGDMLGSQGLEDADVPFEEAVRTPLILRYPQRLRAGGQYDSLASNVDLAPTLLALCEAAPADAMQGRDLMGEQPESVYSVGQLGSPGEWRMVVRGFDKLVLNRDQSVTHLFNLAQDPFEMDNRAQDPSQELKRDELRALLKDWMRRTGDNMDPSGLKRRGPAVKRGEQLEPKHR